MLWPLLDRPSRALLRSQSGPRSGAWLTALPTEAGFCLSPLRMQTALRRRLRLPLPLRTNRCGGDGLPGCGARVDAWGDHAAACPRAGLLQRRAKPLERAWVRVAREAVGAEGQVLPQPWLANTTANVPAHDRRRLDMVVYGADPLGRAQCCDVTLVSPISRVGQPQPRADVRDGACVRRARRRKRRVYPELLRGGPHALVVLAGEIGGRWHRDALDFVHRLTLRTRRAPRVLRASAAQAWDRRWWALISVAAQDAVAASLVEGAVAAWPSPTGFDEPHLGDVLGWQPPAPDVSRLPLR